MTNENMVTLCKIFCSDPNFTLILEPILCLLLPPITQKITQLLVYYFLRYREIVLAKNFVKLRNSF